MGNSVSCFDPVREHPPYSWPKDHPERAAAIAEQKRQRRNQKIVGTGGGAHTVTREAAKPVATPDEKIPLVETKDEAKEVEKDAVVEETKADEVVDEKKVEVVDKAAVAVGTDDDKKEEVKEEVEEAAEAVEEAKDEVADKAGEGEMAIDVAAETAEVAETADAVVEEKDAVLEDAEKQVDAEVDPAAAAVVAGQVDDEKEDEDAKKAVEDEAAKEAAAVVADTPVEEEKKEEETKEDEEPEPEVVVPAVVAEEKEPLAEAELEEKVDLKPPPEPEPEPVEFATIDSRRAMFEQTADDELPEAKEVKRDVLDPVTNEYITITEYRKRQNDRARGVVKERVEKYEEVDDQTAKERADFAAIEAHRTEAIQRADWSFKHKGLETSGSGTQLPGIEDEGELQDTIPVAKEDTKGDVDEGIVSGEKISEDVQDKVEEATTTIETETTEEVKDAALSTAASPLPIA